MPTAVFENRDTGP